VPVSTSTVPLPSRAPIVSLTPKRSVPGLLTVTSAVSDSDPPMSKVSTPLLTMVAPVGPPARTNLVPVPSIVSDETPLRGRFERG
jgi:hypothetical protein